MTADVNFAVTNFALSTASAGGTQDVTVSGFGTPKAVIFIVSGATTSNTSEAGLYFCTGYADGTNQAYAGIAAQDNAGTTDTGRIIDNDACIGLPTYSGGTYCKFGFNSWVTDGVRLDIDSSSAAAFLVTAIFINGDDVASTHIGLKDDLGTGTSAIDISTVGFQPDLVFMNTTGDNAKGTSTAGIYSFGAALSDSTQRFVSLASTDSSSSTKSTAYISNNAIAGQIYNDTKTWDATIGSFDSSGFSITPSSSAGSDIVIYFCMKFTNDPDIALFDMQWPTSGNYAETAPGFTPAFGMLASLVGPTARNTVTTSSTGVLALSAFTNSSIHTVSAQDDDTADPTNANALESDSLRILKADNSGNAVLASSYALDSSGWDFTLSTNPASAVLGWGLAIGTGGGAQSIAVNGITQSQSIGGVTLTQAHELSVNDIDQGQLIGTTALVQASVISPAGVDQTQFLDSVLLTQAHVVAVNDLDQSQTTGGVTLAQAGSIAAAGITQAQLIDATALAQANILSMNDVQQSQGIDGVVLTVAGSLAIQAIVQAQSVDNVLLTQAGVLSIDDLTQEQIINSSSLIQYYQLAVQNLIQGQEASNITLSAAGLGLSIDGLLQPQVIGGAGLTEFAVLSVNDLAQSQIIDLANLGGLVVGCLSGKLVFYAKVGGQVVMYSLSDDVVN